MEGIIKPTVVNPCSNAGTSAVPTVDAEVSEVDDGDLVPEKMEIDGWSEAPLLSDNQILVTTEFSNGFLWVDPRSVGTENWITLQSIDGNWKGSCLERYTVSQISMKRDLFNHIVRLSFRGLGNAICDALDEFYSDCGEIAFTAYIRAHELASGCYDREAVCKILIPYLEDLDNVEDESMREELFIPHLQKLVAIHDEAFAKPSIAR